MFLNKDVIVKTQLGDTIEGTFVDEDQYTIRIKPRNGSDVVMVIKRYIVWITTKNNYQRINNVVVGNVAGRISFELVEKIQNINFDALAEIMDKIYDSLCNLNREDPRFNTFIELSKNIENYLESIGLNTSGEGLWWKRFTQIGKDTNEERIRQNLSEIQEKVGEIGYEDLKNIIQEFLKSFETEDKDIDSVDTTITNNVEIDVKDPRSEEAEYYRNLLS